MDERDCKARELAEYALLQLFSDGDTIDEVEFLFIKRLALSDGVVDEEERRVLGRIFARVDPSRVSAEVWESISLMKTRFGID
jgi:hypothetical protein